MVMTFTAPPCFSEGLLYGVLVKGVDDRRDALTLKPSSLLVEIHFRGLGDLLDADDDVQAFTHLEPTIN